MPALDLDIALNERAADERSFDSESHLAILAGERL
jgi:hypothetical protein